MVPVRVSDEEVQFADLVSHDLHAQVADTAAGVEDKKLVPAGERHA